MSAPLPPIAVTPRPRPSVSVLVGPRAGVGSVTVEGPEGPPGEAGAPGPPGPGLSTTVIVQSPASSVWTLAHGLGRYPSVTLVDDAGDQFAAAVQYLDANTILITLNAPTAGVAYLN